MDAHRATEPDVLVVGSGFGGSLAAWPLVEAGLRVEMVERGGWVRRDPGNWAPGGTLELTDHYRRHARYVRRDDGHETRTGSTACVGGPSVFYGTVSLRFRRDDFAPHPEVYGHDRPPWPLGYDDLAPHYRAAESLLRVAGASGAGPEGPGRLRPYPRPAAELAPVAERIASAAGRLGLHPFRLPLAINYEAAGPGPPCARCPTCDTFACAIGAKNDLATTVIPGLLRTGMKIRPETSAVRLVAEGDRVVAVECLDLRTGERIVRRPGTVLLAAGALGSPQLLLASGLHERNPAGDAVGRHLLRHCSAIVFGLLPGLDHGGERFHKQIGINDFYFGHPDVREPRGKLGNIQQVQTPSVGHLRSVFPRPVARLLSPVVRRTTGLLVLAEDQPQPENRVEVDRDERDAFGLPRLVIRHAHTDRDEAARRALVGRAREILRAAGALAFYVHEIDTFSHALGTVRMGSDPESAPLDEGGRFRGLRNLYVSDGSALPSSAGVNPSLTIAANALRVGSRIAASGAGAAAGARAGVASGP